MPSSGLLTLYHPALDAGSRPPCVIPNRKQSASDWGSSPSRHPALDTGSSPAWIPVFTGMTPPVSSPTESKALRIGDPFGLDSRFDGNDTFFVIPSLTGDPVGLDFRFHGNDGRGAGMTKRRYGNDKRNENDNR